MYVYVHVCVFVCGGQRSTLRVIPREIKNLVRFSHWGQVLAEQFVLADLQARRDLPVSASVTKPTFYINARESELRSSCVYSKHFTD